MANCMSSMGLRDFIDEQRRAERLKTKKPVLERLSQSIPWESFRPLLEKVMRGSAKEMAISGELIR